MRVSSEQLAYWYLRLNGFLTIRNFIIHSEYRREGVGTDADILGVRFAHRKEMQRRPLEDDTWVQSHSGALLLVVAEVKRGRCALNGPWTNADRRNVQKVLAAIGLFPEHRIDAVARDVYEQGFHRSAEQAVGLLAFGESRNEELGERLPAVTQILWPGVLAFIYHRFSEYRQEKSWHQPWDRIGEGLYELAETEEDLESFSRVIHIIP